MRYFHQPLLWLFLWPLSWTAQAVTEEEVFALSLEALSRLEVSIATGTPKRLTEAPAATSVITAADMQAMGAQDLGEALEGVPGLHVSNGSLIYGPRYFIRGIVSSYNPHTLVLVNGIPQTSLFLGGRNEQLPGLYSLPVPLIKRIEIIRGPGSAVYGADAFAGVINIITKGPADIDGGQATLSAGSFDTRRVSLLQSGSLGVVQAALSLSYQRTDGDTSTVINSDLQSNIDANPQNPAPPASLAPGPPATSVRDYDARLDLSWSNFRLRLGWMRAWDIGTGQGVNDALDPDSRFIQNHGNVDLGWSNPDRFAHWNLETQISYLYNSLENPTFIRLFPPGAFFGSFPDGVIAQPQLWEENARFHVTALYTGWEDHLLRLGTGFYWGDLFKTEDTKNYFSGGLVLTPRPLTNVSDTPDVFQPENQRTNAFVFVQDEWQLATDWELTAGLRHDHYSDFGSTTNPRLALVWHTTPTLTSKLLYGTAFRAPAFFELYGTDNPVALGNPDLRPEKLKSLELALGWKPGSPLSWDLNLYAFHIHDFIDFVNDTGTGTFTAQNAGRIEGRGFETELRYQWRDGLQLLANYSHQQTKDNNSGKPLGQAPSAEASLRAIWEFLPRWQLTPQLNWISERKRQAGDMRESLDGYTTFDLALRQRLPKDFTLALIGRNLFDADVREPSHGPGQGQTVPAIPNDLPQAGRSLTLEASARW